MVHLAEALGVVVEVRNRGTRVRINGDIKCGVPDEWREEIDSKITETHSMLSSLVEHTTHLPKLSNIADSMERIEGKLLSSATGKDHTENKTVLIVLKILGAVIVGLTIVIVYLLTGLKLGWISGLH